MRASGILMPISSLPSPYGIGCFSKEAYAFVDWLGFDPRHTAANARTIPAGNRTMTVFEPPAAFQGEPHIEEKEQAYEFAWYRDWLAALAHVVTENAALADGTLHDPAQTERLRAILHLWKD